MNDPRGAADNSAVLVFHEAPANVAVMGVRVALNLLIILLWPSAPVVLLVVAWVSLLTVPLSLLAFVRRAVTVDDHSVAVTGLLRTKQFCRHSEIELKPRKPLKSYGPWLTTPKLPKLQFNDGPPVRVTIESSDHQLATIPLLAFRKRDRHSMIDAVTHALI